MVEVIIRKDGKTVTSFEPTADDLLEIMKMAYDLGIEEEEEEGTLGTRHAINWSKGGRKKQMRTPPCPRCKSRNTIGDGKRDGKQYYKCKDCNRSFAKRECIICNADISHRPKQTRYCHDCSQKKYRDDITRYAQKQKMKRAQQVEEQEQETDDKLCIICGKKEAIEGDIFCVTCYGKIGDRNKNYMRKNFLEKHPKRLKNIDSKLLEDIQFENKFKEFNE